MQIVLDIRYMLSAGLRFCLSLIHSILQFMKYWQGVINKFMEDFPLNALSDLSRNLTFNSLTLQLAVIRTVEAIYEEGN